MRKILICDDKVHRRQQLLGDDIHKLEQLVKDGVVFLKNDNSDIDSHLQEYDMIAIHSSLIGSPNEITEFRARNENILKRKTLIFFSGGEPTWRHESDRLLHMNVNDFYSQRLFSFIEAISDATHNISLVEFHFGNMAQLAPISEINHKLWLNELAPKEKFEEDIDNACVQLNLDPYAHDFKSKFKQLYQQLISNIWK